MACFHFHLIGVAQPIDLDVPFGSISELKSAVSRERFIEGTLSEADRDGVLLGTLIATSRIQCVVEHH